MRGLMQRPGDARFYICILHPQADINFPSSCVRIFWVHKKVLRRENAAARAISFHGDSTAEDFIICVGPIESDRPDWETWKSTQ